MEINISITISQNYQLSTKIAIRFGQVRSLGIDWKQLDKREDYIAC